jgi:transcriptional regulator with XRE-family HTH domain
MATTPPVTAATVIGVRWDRFDREKLRAERIKQDLTQAQLAERLGAERNRVSEWESGTRAPHPRTLRALADALRVAPHQLSTVNLADATLKDLRYFAGLDVAEVAGLLGVSNDLVARLEAGSRNPTPGTIETLAALYRVTTTELKAASETSKETSKETNDR